MSTDRDREVDDLRRLLAGHGLLDEHRAPGDEPTTARDEALLARILATPQAPSQAPARPGVRARRAPLLAAAAVVAGALAVVLPLTRSAPSAAMETPPLLTYGAADPADLAGAEPATEVLTAAALAAAQAEPPARAGDVQHVTTFGWDLAVDVSAEGTTSVLYPTVTEQWLAADGSAVITQARGGALDLDGHVTTGPDEGETAMDRLPAATFDPTVAAALPTDPAALHDALLARSAYLPCDQDDRWEAQCLVEAVQGVYAQYVVPPELAAAFWEVLAGQPALVDLGTTTDRLGRAAHAVALPSSDEDPAMRSVGVLLVSPTSGALLGRETVTLRNDALEITEPTTTGFAAWSAAEWVASAP